MAKRLAYQFELIQLIRDFFIQNNFVDVLTPPMVANPGMETHIHPFQITQAKTQELTSMYLHTSPEFQMKELLASDEGLNNIFTLGYCFRDEPKSEIHRPQFLMLEWYRKNERYEKIMDDVEKLLLFIQSRFTAKHLLKTNIHSFPRVSVQDLFLEFLHFDILEFMDTKSLKQKIQKDFKDVPLPHEECSWDDYYFLLFLNKIETELKNYPYLLIKEFPAPLAALSTISTNDSRVSERFEVYLSGVELCNCFNELTNPHEQKNRFELQTKDKKEIYDYELPWPKEFMSVLEEGYPASSGIALGVERLLYSLINIENAFFK
ncbi:MAG: hypothetical protein HON90_13460 [Halobacteriovoraceae bacterium]|jgi:elongation factor P--(R)-beta-lysine ligase|nr:hypothetical protein [Halobacteriovoraceae bacterium]